MGMPAEKVLQEALALGKDERLRLVSELLASVDGPADANWEDAWRSELDGRLREADAGGSPDEEWPDVEQRIRARLAR
jgi:putative addiction module component (TIGR02574 family)